MVAPNFDACTDRMDWTRPQAEIILAAVQEAIPDLPKIWVGLDSDGKPGLQSYGAPTVPVARAVHLACHKAAFLLGIDTDEPCGTWAHVPEDQETWV